MKAITALCFSLGLILAMSEGQYFPYLNVAGVGLFSLTPVLVWRADRKQITKQSINRRTHGNI